MALSTSSHKPKNENKFFQNLSGISFLFLSFKIILIFSLISFYFSKNYFFLLQKYLSSFAYSLKKNIFILPLALLNFWNFRFKKIYIKKKILVVSCQLIYYTFLHSLNFLAFFQCIIVVFVKQIWK